MENSKLNCLELFSGIGGLRLGFKDYIENCTSFDMNEHANVVYTQNFNSTPNNTSISYLKEKDITGFDIWLMSPNCQPFTIRGNMEDEKDTRTEPFLHVIQLLSMVKSPPQYLFLENVPQFYNSNTYNLFKKVLLKQHYTIQPVIMCPSELGIPNTRKRCFLFAHLSEPKELPLLSFPIDPFRVKYTLKDYLGDSPNGELVPIELFKKFPNFIHDIVTIDCYKTSTFTKSYGSKNILRNGSFIGSICTLEHKDQYDLDKVIHSKARFLSVDQLLILFGFPKDFKMDNVTQKQKYALIGNSVNVNVISCLANHFLGHQSK